MSERARGLFFPCLPGGIACVARGLALRLERYFPGGLFGLLTLQLFGCLLSQFGFTGLLFGLGGLAGSLCFCLDGGTRLALRAALLHGRIVRAGLRAELFENVFLASRAAC